MLSVSSLALALPAAQSPRPQFVGLLFWASWALSAVELWWGFAFAFTLPRLRCCCCGGCFPLLFSADGLRAKLRCMALATRAFTQRSQSGGTGSVSRLSTKKKQKKLKTKNPNRNKINSTIQPPLTHPLVRSLTHQYKYKPKSHKKNTYTTRVFVFSTALSNSCELVNFRFLYSPLFSDQRSRPTFLIATTPTHLPGDLHWN